MKTVTALAALIAGLISSSAWARAARHRLWRRIRLQLERLTRAAGHLDQQPHPEPGRAPVGEVGPADVVGGAGDVQVRPRGLAGEAVQELARGQRGRLALGGA